MGWFSTALQGAASSGFATAASGAVQSIFGNLLSKANARRQYYYQSKLMDKEYQQQRQLTLDNAAMTKQGLQNAGLSPAMMMTGVPQPASAPKGSSSFGSSSVSAMPAQDPAIAEANLMAAQAKLVEKQAEGQEIDNENKPKNYELTFNKLITESNWFNQQIANAKVQEGKLKFELDNMQRVLDMNMNKLDAETSEALANIERWEKEKPFIAEKFQREFELMAAQTEMSNAQAFQAYKLAQLYKSQEEDLRHQIEAKLKTSFGASAYLKRQGIENGNTYDVLVTSAALQQVYTQEMTDMSYAAMEQLITPQTKKTLNDLGFDDNDVVRVIKLIMGILSSAASGAGTAALFKFMK